MADYTELIRALRCKNEEWGYYTKCKYYGEPSDNRCVLCDSERLAHDAATAIEALQAKVPHWVRCDEALPEIGQRVIVYDGWMQFMTRKDEQLFNGKMYWENEEGNWERVDHEAYWMPIEPPQEVQE